MKRKSQNQVYQPLEFANNFVPQSKDLTDFQSCLDYAGTIIPRYEKMGLFPVGMTSKENMASTIYTLADWLKYKQAYKITQELAEDLFSSDTSIPIELIKLPFPTIFIDMESVSPSVTQKKFIGVYLTIDEVPYGEAVLSLCSVVTLAFGEKEYQFGGLSFDFYPEHMDQSLDELLRKMTNGIPDALNPIRQALLFAAYISSKDPDITENEAQASIYRPSVKNKPSSIRKWDVGVRYAKEVKKRQDSEQAHLGSHSGKGTRKPPRVHMRRAHWRVARVGKGRKERKAVWIPPVEVGGRSKEIPAVVRVLDTENETHPPR